MSDVPNPVEETPVAQPAPESTAPVTTEEPPKTEAPVESEATEGDATTAAPATTEETAAPKEETVDKDAAKVESVPASEGVLGYKHQPFPSYVCPCACNPCHRQE